MGHNARLSEEELLRIFVEGVEDYAIFALDPDGHVASWNVGAERIKGYQRSDILGRYFGCFYTPEDRAAGKPERVLEFARCNSRYSEEGLRVRRDGTRFWASVVVTAIRDESGTLRGFTKVTRDITARRNSERLQRESDAALERERMRRRFLQIAAHELRNPMQGMKGMVDLVRLRTQAGHPLEHQDTLLRMLDREVDRLSTLLNEVLEAYRTDDPSFQIHKQPLNLEHVLQDAVAPIREGHGDYQYHIDMSQAAVTVNGDSVRLEAVFRNLVENGVKYSSPGSEILVEVVASDHDVEVVVIDRGFGIPEQDIDRVFEGFFRGSNLQGRDPGGMGLGLHLCHQTIDKHHGRIWIERHSGPGTRVHVVLPRAGDGD